MVIVTFLSFIYFFGILSIKAEVSSNIVQQMLESYSSVTSVICEVRRTVKSEEGTVVYLSRVFYARPDRINVENFSPVKRRIISDGRMFYSYIDSASKGVKIEISKLPEDYLISLRAIPGTAMEHLMRIVNNIQQEDLPDEGELKRYGFHVKNQYVVLSVIPTNKLVCIEFFTDRDMKNRTAVFNYSNFKRIKEDVWIACLIKAEVNLGGIKSFHHIIISNLEVNVPLAKGIFSPENFFDFKKVEFSDNLESMP